MSKKKQKDVKLCDRNCNECPILFHPNSRMLTAVLNELFKKFGDGVYEIVQNFDPNFTVCYDCRTDDFGHYKGCEIIEEARKMRDPEYRFAAR